MNKKIIASLALVTTVLGTAMYANQVNAFGFGNNNDVVQRLAQSIGKSEAEVQSVFDQLHEERHAEKEAQFEANLDEAINAGTITAEQKQLLLEKHDEMEADNQSLFENRDTMTQEEWKEAHQSRRAEMEAWADENGIDLNAVHVGGFGSKGPGMNGRHMGR